MTRSRNLTFSPSPQLYKPADGFEGACIELRSRASAIVNFVARARTEDLLRCIWCAISVKLKPVRARLRSRSSSSVDQRGALVILSP
jgi:hypothetical protein